MKYDASFSERSLWGTAKWAAQVVGVSSDTFPPLDPERFAAVARLIAEAEGHIEERGMLPALEDRR